jgi:hypothetical protein
MRTSQHACSAQSCEERRRLAAKREPVVVAVVAHYSSSNCMLGSYLVRVITWVCPVIRAVVVIYYYYYVPGPLHDQAKRGLLFFFLRESEKRASDQKRCHRTYADTPAQLMLTLRC